MNASRFLTRSPAVAFVLALAGCGGGGGSGTPAPEHATIRTLAYVDTVCHQDAHGASASQRLQVVRGDAAPVTVAEIPTYGPLPALGLCPGFGANGDGNFSVYALAFQRLGVSPDGSGVVFEVTLQNSPFTTLGLPSPLTPEQEGIFFVRSDGTGLRKLGPPSREPAQRVLGPLTAPTGLWSNDLLLFRPDGRAITFIDRGPGPAGEDAPQVVILNYMTGIRRPVTRLPNLPPDPLDPAPATDFAAFTDDATIQYSSRVNPSGPNPDGRRLLFSVKTDGTMLAELPLPVLLPGSVIVPSFFITRSPTFFDVGTASLPCPATSSLPCPPIQEVFVLSSDHVLQLTNFRRGDTGGNVNTDGQRVFFVASANPFGTNPSENCQIFSISSLGDDLRQLTYFRAADHSAIGCAYGVSQPPQPGCIIYPNELILDSQIQTLVFPSNCDPLGTHSNGKQYFAMRSDGTGLRQLIATRGLVTAEDGSVDVELAGPLMYPFF